MRESQVRDHHFNGVSKVYEFHLWLIQAYAPGTEALGFPVVIWGQNGETITSVLRLRHWHAADLDRIPIRRPEPLVCNTYS